MINALNFLLESRRIIFNELENEIIDINLDKSIYQIKIQFTTGSILFIRFNRFNEYGYQLIFSKKKYDFVRWDNFDDKWSVATRPHHFHLRNKNGVIESKMKGIPSTDIPLLIRYIKEEVL